MPPLVTIIIPTRDRREELLACLGSLPLQEELAEVIVVDDGSRDSTAAIVAERFPRVRILRNACCLGPGYSRNRGILAATGKYVLFLDSDVELLDRGMIERMVRAFDAEPNLGEIGGEMTEISGRIAGRRITANGDSRPVFASSEEGIVECDFLATCNCMVRREIALRVGGFDPYYGFGGEDKDFGARLRRAGLRNCFGAAFAVLHKRSSAGRDPDETYRYHRTRIRFVLKNLSPIRWAVCLVCDAVRILSFYPLLPLKLLVKLLRRQKLRRENLTAPIMLIRAYLWNLRRFLHTRRCKGINFLSAEEMERFERHWQREAG